MRDQKNCMACFYILTLLLFVCNSVLYNFVFIFTYRDMVCVSNNVLFLFKIQTEKNKLTRRKKEI